MYAKNEFLIISWNCNNKIIQLKLPEKDIFHLKIRQTYTGCCVLHAIPTK